MQRACGITSPKINKSVTEITTAVNLLKTLSKNTGKASIAKLFIKSKVHKSQWRLDNTGKITFEASFSSGVPVFSLNSIVNWSTDKYPTVKPLIIPANKVKNATINIQNQ